MCGIAGVVNLGSRSVGRSEVDSMVQRLLPRGPDHHAVKVQAHVGLGHTRLSILDLSERGNQPFETADGSGMLVYNGEIFNYVELREELEREGVEFRSETDTEVVLQALHTWGACKAVPRFNGMFAFGYADFRDNTVWLSRDRLGIKPLFVAQLENQLIFASEQKALLAHPEVPQDIDVQSVASLLLYERFNDTETPYLATQNFLPGTLMRVSSTGIETTTYFDVLRDIEVEKIQNKQKSFAQTSEEFEAALERSVERHMISDAPLASLCSGGLDSGLVTAIAARKKPGLVCYVADMEGMHGEEFHRASCVADHVGTELRRVPLDRATFLRELPKAIAANDQPLFFAQEVALMVIARQIRQDGFKVVLSGDGADELFGGYPWYAETLRQWNRLDWRGRYLPKSGLLRALSRLIPSLLSPDVDKLVRNYALTKEPIEYVATSLNIAPVGGMVRTLRQRDLFARLQALPLGERAYLARNLEDIYVHMRESLNSKDKMAMRYGIEARVPFIENELIQLGINLPVSHKNHRNIPKALIDQMATRWLPDKVLNKPKIGFNAPPPLWDGTESFLENGRVAELLKWPKDRHKQIMAMFKPWNHVNFRLLACELWLRLHVDGESPETLAELLVATK